MGVNLKFLLVKLFSVWIYSIYTIIFLLLNVSAFSMFIHEQTGQFVGLHMAYLQRYRKFFLEHPNFSNSNALMYSTEPPSWKISAFYTPVAGLRQGHSQSARPICPTQKAACNGIMVAKYKYAQISSKYSKIRQEQTQKKNDHPI